MTPVEKVCAWFALCGRPAVSSVRHPILGNVPVCARCFVRAGEQK